MWSWRSCTPPYLCRMRSRPPLCDSYKHMYGRGGRHQPLYSDILIQVVQNENLETDIIHIYVSLKRSTEQLRVRIVRSRHTFMHAARPSFMRRLIDGSYVRKASRAYQQRAMLLTSLRYLAISRSSSCRSVVFARVKSRMDGALVIRMDGIANDDG